MNTLLKQGMQTGANMNMDLKTAINAVKSNPMQFILNSGINTTGNLGNNPQSIANYLMNSNQVSPANKQIAKIAMQKLGL